MTAEDFRALALSMPGAVEATHMGHPDFRAGPRRRIFATLNEDDEGEYGVVMLSPEQQAEVLDASPGGFAPVKGRWGERGATRIVLERASERAVAAAIKNAWSSAVGGEGR